MSKGNDLERLVRDVAGAETRLLDTAARAGQSALRESVDSGYRTGADIEGVPYLLPKDGHRPPMERSGRLRRAYCYLVATIVGGRLLTVVEDTSYGQFLRDGTSKMAPRQHMPKPDAELPPSWRQRLKEAIEGALARVRL